MVNLSLNLVSAKRVASFPALAKGPSPAQSKAMVVLIHAQATPTLAHVKTLTLSKLHRNTNSSSTNHHRNSNILSTRRCQPIRSRNDASLRSGSGASTR